jgi:hypothetical protein
MRGQISRVDVWYLNSTEHVLGCSPVRRRVNEWVNDMLVDLNRLVEDEVRGQQHVEAVKV